MVVDKEFTFDDDDNGPDPLDADYEVTVERVSPEVARAIVNEEDPFEVHAQGRAAYETTVDAASPGGDYTVVRTINTETGELVAEEQHPVPESLPVVYEGLSAKFKPGTWEEDKAKAVQVWVQAHDASPCFLGDLIGQWYKEDGTSYEDIGSQVGLKASTTKNYASWCSRVPAENRKPGMTVTILQEAASIRDLDEQAAFIKTAVAGDYTKLQLRALKEGREPEDTDDSTAGPPDEEQHTPEKQKCPTCGTMVRAELLD